MTTYNRPSTQIINFTRRAAQEIFGDNADLIETIHRNGCFTAYFTNTSKLREVANEAGYTLYAIRGSDKGRFYRVCRLYTKPVFDFAGMFDAIAQYATMCVENNIAPEAYTRWIEWKPDQPIPDDMDVACTVFTPHVWYILPADPNRGYVYPIVPESNPWIELSEIHREIHPGRNLNNMECIYYDNSGVPWRVIAITRGYRDNEANNQLVCLMQHRGVRLQSEFAIMFLSTQQRVKVTANSGYYPLLPGVSDLAINAGIEAHIYQRYGSEYEITVAITPEGERNSTDIKCHITFRPDEMDNADPKTKVQYNKIVLEWRNVNADMERAQMLLSVYNCALTLGVKLEQTKVIQ